MKIEIVKETNSYGRIWLRVYINNNYEKSFDTEKGARDYVNKIKSKRIIINTKEIIHTEEI